MFHGHLSAAPVARRLQQSTRSVRSESKLLHDFAPNEVCLCRFCCQNRGRLLPCLFTLTCPLRPAVIFCSTFCRLRSFAESCSFPFSPGYYPAFFPTEPGLFLMAPASSSLCHAAIYPYFFTRCIRSVPYQKPYLHPNLRRVLLCLPGTNPRLKDLQDFLLLPY